MAGANANRIVPGKRYRERTPVHQRPFSMPARGGLASVARYSLFRLGYNTCEYASFCFRGATQGRVKPWIKDEADPSWAAGQPPQLGFGFGTIA